MDQVNNVLNGIMKGFDSWMANPYFATTITIILAVYASLASPKLPSYFKKLFDNSIFKILIITFIAYRANSNPQLSLLIAICFVITLNFLAEKETKEAFEQIETFGQLEHFANTLDIDGGIEPFDGQVVPIVALEPEPSSESEYSSDSPSTTVSSSESHADSTTDSHYSSSASASVSEYLYDTESAVEDAEIESQTNQSIIK